MLEESKHDQPSPYKSGPSVFSQTYSRELQDIHSKKIITLEKKLVDLQAKDKPDRHKIIGIFIEIFGLYRNQGQLDQAEEYLTRAVAFAFDEKPEDFSEEMKTLIKEWRLSEEYLISRSIKEPLTVIRTFIKLSNLYGEWKQLAEQEAVLGYVQHILQKTITTIVMADAEKTVLAQEIETALANLAKTYGVLGNTTREKEISITLSLLREMKKNPKGISPDEAFSLVICELDFIFRLQLGEVLPEVKNILEKEKSVEEAKALEEGRVLEEPADIIRGTLIASSPVESSFKKIELVFGAQCRRIGRSGAGVVLTGKLSSEKFQALEALEASEDLRFFDVRKNRLASTQKSTSAAAANAAAQASSICRFLSQADEENFQETLGQKIFNLLAAIKNEDKSISDLDAMAITQVVVEALSTWTDSDRLNSNIYLRRYLETCEIPENLNLLIRTYVAEHADLYELNNHVEYVEYLKDSLLNGDFSAFAACFDIAYLPDSPVGASSSSAASASAQL